MFSHDALISGTSSTETTIVEDVRESTILDPLVITLPVVIIISVISSTLACLALLINLFKYRRKTPHPNLPESIDLNTDSIGLLETFELNVFTNSDSENNIRGAKVTEETVEVNDLRNRNENETEISGHMEPTLTEIPIRAPTHVLEITTSL